MAAPPGYIETGPGVYVKQNDPSGAQAAAINTAYLQNRLPVTPAIAPGGGARYTPEEIADAAAEQAKHEAAFGAIDYSAYANMPLSQMPPNIADRVQDYYAAHPSARAQEITQQYAAQQGRVIGETGVMYQQPVAPTNPYDPNTAAGIAWEVARTGGVTTASLANRAIGEGYRGDILAVSGISTVPTREPSSGMVSGSRVVAGLPDATRTFYVPYGEFAQIEIKDAKGLMDFATGELGIYQKPAGHSQYMLIAGGGRAALQSGMFTIDKAETPYVISQEKSGTYSLPSGEGLSRLGAEGYGGFVRPLSDKVLLAPNEAVSRYFGMGGDINLANLVAQIPAEKAAVPGAKIPWGIEASMPALSYMDEKGIIAGSGVQVPSGGRLVGGKTVASVPGLTELPSGTPETTRTAEQASGKIFGFDVPVLSPVLAFFQPGTETERTTTTKVLPSETVFERREITLSPTPGAYSYTDYYKTTGGKEVSESVTTKATPSAFDKAFEGANAAIRSTLFMDKQKPLTTEQVKAAAPYIAANIFTAPVGLVMMEPVIGDYMASYVKGEVTATQEKPAQAGLMFGAGLVMGGLFKAGETVYGVGRAATAEKVISEGGIWRGIEQGGQAVMEYGPKILGGLYAADVAVRSTNRGTDFSPASAERFGTIMALEARPMTAGAVMGYSGPGKVYDAAKLSDIGFKTAMQEGTTTGRVDYYIKQPVTRPYELVKQDYLSYVQEKVARTPSVSTEKPSVGDYILQKLDKPVAAEPTTLKPRQSFVIEDNIIKPVTTEPPADIATLAYRGKVGTGRYIPAPKEPMTLGRISEVEATAPDVITKAYGKEPGMFDFTLRGKQAEPFTLGNIARDEFAIDTRKVYPRDYSIGQKIDIWEQEHPTFFRDIKSQIVRPTKEIIDINRMTELNKQIAKAPAPAVAGKGFKRTPLNKTFGFGQKKPQKPAKPSGVETRTKGGAVLVSKAEPAAAMEPVLGRPVSAGAFPILANVQMPAYPSAPSPTQRRYTVVDEDVEYVRTTGPVQERRLQQVPMPSLTILPAAATVVARTQVPDIVPRTRQDTVVTPFNIYANLGKSIYDQRSDFIQTRKPVFETERTRITVPDRITRSEQAIGISTRFDRATDVTRTQTTREVTTQRQITTWEIPPPPPPIPGFGFTPSGGGGAGGGMRKGSRSYTEILGFEYNLQSRLKRKKRKWGF